MNPENRERKLLKRSHMINMMAELDFFGIPLPHILFPNYFKVNNCLIKFCVKLWWSIMSSSLPLQFK